MSLSIQGLFEPKHQSRWPHLGSIAILLSILPIAILLSILPKSHPRAPVDICCCDRPIVGLSSRPFVDSRSAASRDRGGDASIERRRRKHREAASFKRLSLEPSNEFFLRRFA